MRTCYEQRVHARRRLRGLEHLADVLLGQRGLASALPLGVLLLPPLEVLKVGEQRKVGEKKGGKGRRGGGMHDKDEGRRQARKNIRKAQRNTEIVRRDGGGGAD